jgi:hypothetical protein
LSTCGGKVDWLLEKIEADIAVIKNDIKMIARFDRDDLREDEGPPPVLCSQPPDL